jgi:hypothetical protein
MMVRAILLHFTRYLQLNLKKSDGKPDAVGLKQPSFFYLFPDNSDLLI